MVLRNSLDPTGAFEVYSYDVSNNALVGTSLGAVGLDWEVGGIAVDPPTGSPASMSHSSAAAQLVQSMAGFDAGGGSADIFDPVWVGAEMSQQPLLAAPQHA
jgi:hypothetical protein